MSELPTSPLRAEEPFGFVDGISQPVIDWEQQQSTDLHDRDKYSNLLALGEVVLGYENEYGLYTPRPLLDPERFPGAKTLPDAADEPSLKDFGRNGSYLVVRQLDQDVSAFWKYVDQQSGSDSAQREQLAARMVGRYRDGTPLVDTSVHRIAGTDVHAANNHFTYDLDPDGLNCPVTAHIRRSNPRTGDYPANVNGFWSRVVRLFGFGQARDDEDLIASSRFHRLLRRGRPYGKAISPEQAISSKRKTGSPHGLEFLCLVGNISRQFEFVQNAWNMSAKFAGLHNERDPLIATREPLEDGSATDRFISPQHNGLNRCYQNLSQFVTVRGGAYFFMPGLRALKFLASIDANGDGDAHES